MNAHRNLTRKFHLIVRLFTFESQYLNKNVGFIELNIIIRWPTSLKTLKCAGLSFNWTHGKAMGFYWEIVFGILDFHFSGFQFHIPDLPFDLTCSNADNRSTHSH